MRGVGVKAYLSIIVEGNVNITDNLLRTIDYAIDQKTKKFQTMDTSGLIVALPDNNGAYLVEINDAQYRIPNGSGIGFKVGDLVWVHCPNGDFKKKFIISSRTGNSKMYSNESDSEYGEGSGINPDDIITDAEIDAMFT